MKSQNDKKNTIRSQSMLKSQIDFNVDYNNKVNTTGSIGSNTTQRAQLTYTNVAPDSKSTSKGGQKTTMNLSQN